MKMSRMVLVAAAVAVSIAFIGCGNGANGNDDPPGPGGPMPDRPPEATGTEVFVFSTAIMADQALGAIADGQGFFDGTAMSQAGGPILSVVAGLSGRDTLGLHVVPNAGWGAGIDLNNAAINFQAGDVVWVVGVDRGSGTFEVNTNVGAAETNTRPMTTGEVFSQVVVLDAAAIGQITAASPSAIRFAARPDAAAFEIHEIIVFRP